MKLLIILCLSFVFVPTNGQTKCRFIGYTISETTDYGKVTHCGSRNHRRIIYGTIKRETGAFLNLTTKKMFYITKQSSCKNYCNLSSQIFFTDWVHKGYRSDWVEKRTYILDLKKIEYENE